MRGLLKERDLDLGFGNPRWGMRGGQEGKERCVCSHTFYQTLNNIASKPVWWEHGGHVKLHF